MSEPKGDRDLRTTGKPRDFVTECFTASRVETAPRDNHDPWTGNVRQT